MLRRVTPVPAHAPLKDDVGEQLYADARLQEAYKLAQEDAKAFLAGLREVQKTKPTAYLGEAA